MNLLSPWNKSVKQCSVYMLYADMSKKKNWPHKQQSAESCLLVKSQHYKLPTLHKKNINHVFEVHIYHRNEQNNSALIGHSWRFARCL